MDYDGRLQGAQFVKLRIVTPECKMREAFLSLTHTCRTLQVRGQAPVGYRQESRRSRFLSGLPQPRRAGRCMRRWLLHDDGMTRPVHCIIVRGNQNAPRPLSVAYAHDHSPTPSGLHGTATQSCQRHVRRGI